MTQPSQLEYIITEEQLQRGHEVMSKTGRKKYEKEIRSYPYQSARDTVLDEIVGMFDNGQYYGITVKQMIQGKVKEIELRQTKQGSGWKCLPDCTFFGECGANDKRTCRKDTKKATELRQKMREEMSKK